MGKSKEQLERDVNAVVKLVLTEMEILAGLPPTQAAEPYSFDERRRKVVRRIWDLYKDTLNHANSVQQP